MKDENVKVEKDMVVSFVDPEAELLFAQKSCNNLLGIFNQKLTLNL